MTYKYDNLEWEINTEIPTGYSTPDEFEEYSYDAKARCHHCGAEISGTAYLNNSPSASPFGYHVDRIDYVPCFECEIEEEVYDVE